MGVSGAGNCRECLKPDHRLRQLRLEAILASPVPLHHKSGGGGSIFPSTLHSQAEFTLVP